jgi:hypothetical protein
VQLQSTREFPSMQISYGSDAEFSTVVQAHIKVFLSPFVSNQIRCDMLVASSVIAKRNVHTTAFLFHVERICADIFQTFYAYFQVLITCF